MGFLKTRQLLYTLAQNYKHQKMSFSKSDISKRINEIKYLSAQKKIPRLTLRKEITHLEVQLKSVLELEKKLIQQKRYESAKIAALRKTNRQLRQKLIATKDKDLHHKVDKLSHHLGDHLAKMKTDENVNMVKKYHLVQTTPNTDSHLHLLHRRLEALKQELDIKKIDEPNPYKIKQIEEQVAVLEDRLNRLSNCRLPEQIEVIKSKEVKQIKPELAKLELDKLELDKTESSRHKMLFGPQNEEKIEKESLKEEIKPAPFSEETENIIENLPLPPPPRITKPDSRELNFSHTVSA